MARLKEDASGDLSLYQEASDIMGHLFRHLFRNEDEFYGFAAHSFNDGYFLTLRGSTIGLDSRDADLWFRFGQQDGYLPGGHFARFKNSREPVVTVSCIDRPIVNAHGRVAVNLQEVVRIILHRHPVHDVLRHELIHYLDNVLRNPGLTGERPRHETGSPGYYNSPQENNAYFVNLAYPLLHFLNVAREGRPLPAGFIEAMGIDADFRTTMANLIDRAKHGSSIGSVHAKFVKNLSQKNRRSMVKRLYQLHQQALKYLPS